MGKRSVEKERQWREIVARYERSGVKVRAFCHQEQIKESQFFAWKRELKRRDAARTYPSGELRWG
jgi:transposase-like protein